MTNIIFRIIMKINNATVLVTGANRGIGHAFANGLRNELRAQNTQVLTLPMAFVDTDMTQGIGMPNSHRSTWFGGRSTPSKPAPRRCWPTS